MAVIAIIGGGTAGIAAARTILKNSSNKVVLIEANGRYGGRALTNRKAIKNFNFDLGPEAIQDAKNNPWTRIAEKLGFKTVTYSLDATYRVNDGGWKDDPDPGTNPSVSEITAEIKDDFEQNKMLPNQAVTDATVLQTDTEQFAYTVNEFGPLFESAMSWEYLAADRARFSEDDETKLWVQEGLGTLVRTYGDLLSKDFGSGFTEYLQFPVGRVKIGSQGFAIISQNGKRQVAASAVLITVPVSTLSDIAFDPALPGAYRQASGLVRLGRYKKVGLRLEKIPSAIKNNTLYYTIDQSGTGVWEYYRYAHYPPNVLVARTAGDFAATLDNQSENQIVQTVKTTLGTAYQTTLKVVESLVTNWWRDPYAQGAYSYTSPAPGGAENRTALNARKQLAKPLNGLYLTGEATSLKAYGTLQGAFWEGVLAAADLLGIDTGDLNRFIDRNVI